MAFGPACVNTAVGCAGCCWGGMSSKRTTLRPSISPSSFQGSRLFQNFVLFRVLGWLVQWILDLQMNIERWSWFDGLFFAIKHFEVMIWKLQSRLANTAPYSKAGSESPNCTCVAAFQEVWIDLQVTSLYLWFPTLLFWNIISQIMCCKISLFWILVGWTKPYKIGGDKKTWNHRPKRVLKIF